MMFGATLRAPHGGIWVLPLIGNFLLFLLALVVGVIVMTLDRRRPEVARHAPRRGRRDRYRLIRA